jgi:hypothetical protein
MKRFSIMLVAALALVAVGCGDDDNPVGPGDDNHVQFTATLLPSNEVPPVTGDEAAASGSVVIDFNLTRDSTGTITAATATFTVNVSGFPSTTSITAAHIHPGAAGATGPVLVSTALAAGQVTLTNGAALFTQSNISVTAANAQAVINNPAGHYFNVHTVAHPGGVMRGQLVKSN